jgi:23S rRNA pseudouridine2605 synthase
VKINKETAVENSPVEGERLQKVLARAGHGSRRQLEKMIEQGLVRVNQQVAQLGDRVVPSDKISMKGRLVKLHHDVSAPPKVLIYHKPAGQIVTRSDPEGREIVFKHLPRLKGERWVPVGRLDINTSGLLILTNNGELAHRMMHPSFQMLRKYAVRIIGKVTDEMMATLESGVELEDGRANFEKIEEKGGEGANRWFHVTLREGRTREVRRLWESQNVMVSRLMRIQYGPVLLPPGLLTGKWQYLDSGSIKQLAELVELPEPEVIEPKPKNLRRNVKKGTYKGRGRR